MRAEAARAKEAARAEAEAAREEAATLRHELEAMKRRLADGADAESLTNSMRAQLSSSEDGQVRRRVEEGAGRGRGGCAKG